jgi:hypothetical protein
MINKYDFGKVELFEELKETQGGLPYLSVRIVGAFWGFEKGKDGSIADYLTKLIEKDHWVIVNLKQATNYSDAAPILINKVRNNLIAKGKGLFLCEPVEYLAEILTIADYDFVESEEEAIRLIESD